MIYSLLIIVGLAALLVGLLFSKDRLHVAAMQILVSLVIGGLLLFSGAFEGLLLILLETLAIINAFFGITEIVKILRERTRRQH